MSRRKRRLSDPVWCSSLLLLIVLQFCWLPGERGAFSDSFSNSVDGTLGLYRTLSQLFPEVSRLTDRLSPDMPCTLLLIAPQRYPTATESQALRQFVMQGGHLIFAPAWQQPDCHLPSLGIELRTSHREADEVEFIVTSSLLPDPVVWRSTARAVAPAVPHRQLVWSAAGAEILNWSLGAGSVTVCSSADVFSNRSLLFADSRRLAVRLIEYVHRGNSMAGGEVHESAQTGSADSDSFRPLVINEYLNGSSAWRSSGILFSPPLRSSTLQAAMVAMLVLWSGFHRFGPARARRSVRRREMTDSAQAIGSLQYRLRDGGVVVRSYLEYVRSQLRRRYGSSVRLDQPAVLAARTRLAADEVHHRLVEAVEAGDQIGVPAERAAFLIRWLAHLHGRLCGH